jgi:hypothetical protein
MALVTLAGISHQPERSARAQLQMRDLHALVDPAYPTASPALVELDRLAKFEGQRHECLGRRTLPVAQTPGPDEVGQAAAAALVALDLEFCLQCLRRSPLVLETTQVDAKRLDHRFVESAP